MITTAAKPNRPKVGLIFLGRRRPGFDQQWGAAMEERVRRRVGAMEFATFEPAEKAVDDPSLRRAVTACLQQGVEAIILLQTTMGDGRLAPTMAQLWPDPLVIWATPENPDGDMISSCSLVGSHVWASTLRQMGRAFDLVYGHPDAAATQTRLREAVRLAATIRRLRSVRLGMIGGHAPGFFAMSAEPFSLHRGLGAQLQTYSLVEFADVVNGVPSEAVQDDVAAVKALRLEHKDTSDADLPMASRLYLGMRAYLENERLDALTVRCWPEMPNTFGQWPYLGIARLANEGRAVVCEGDADGALSAWVAENLGFGRCYITDWLEHDDESITLWHGGAAPMELSPPPGEPGGPRIARHFNIKKPAVLEATLRQNMPITIFRLWRRDGSYYLTARDAETIKPSRHLMGTNGSARLVEENPARWFEAACHEGMPHHVLVFPGHHRELLRRFARAMNMRFL